MEKWLCRLRDGVVTAGILVLCFCASLLMQNRLNTPEHITTCFVFGVFLISVLTDGYFFGMIAGLTGVLLVNYAFTFPYFAVDFASSSNFISAVVMTTIAVCTSALTRQVKRQELIKAEGQRERMRANLLRAISHDLRTPLTTIYGASSVLLDSSDSLTDPQKRELLGSIREDAQWLVRMVENLLSITRIDSGNVKLDKVPTALDELMDSVLVQFGKRYPDQKIHLDLPEELVMIPMDPILIEQVIVNLLENAVQHATGMTRLWMRVTVRHGLAYFEIWDNGCGIPNERLDTIFTGSYDRREKPADGRKHNLGIGLSVCATIIRAHGSRIHAQNRVEGGALFRFALETEETTDE